MALNPAIAEELGWSLGDSPFSWCDSNDQRMVWTMWWTDGLIGLSPPHLDEEVGEGWVVLASPGAWNELKNRFDGLARMSTVTRRFTSEGNEQSQRQVWITRID